MIKAEQYSAFVGQLVSIKLLNGAEIVGILESLDLEYNNLDVKNPQSVFVQDGDLMMMKYMITSDELVHEICADHVQCLALANATVTESFSELSKTDK
jgi:hypothetical protein